jgi:hypothetical protein
MAGMAGMGNGGRDIVSEMAREMNLTPAMVENLQRQQGGYAVPGMGMQGMNGQASTGPMSPEQQMQLMAEVQAQPQEQPEAPGAFDQPGAPEYSDDTGSSSSSSDSVDELDLQKLGLEGSKSWTDVLIYYLKAPVIIAIIFAILTIPAVDNFIRPYVVGVIGYNATYYLLLKALLAGLLGLVAKFTVLD